MVANIEERRAGPSGLRRAPGCPHGRTYASRLILDQKTGLRVGRMARVGMAPKRAGYVKVCRDAPRVLCAPLHARVGDPRPHNNRGSRAPLCARTTCPALYHRSGVELSNSSKSCSKLRIFPLRSGTQGRSACLFTPEIGARTRPATYRSTAGRGPPLPPQDRWRAPPRGGEMTAGPSGGVRAMGFTP